MSRPQGRPAVVEPASGTAPLLARAARREPVEHTPVWFMRQAGRALPEYRAIREEYGIFQICQTPELCAEVSLQPVRRLGVDGAVLFADIMLPVAFGLGVKLDLVESIGPVIEHPIRSAADVDALLATPADEAVPFVMDTIRILRRELPSGVAVIGFSGAPFTLASYLIEGRPSRDFLKTKAIMLGEPALWDALLGRLQRMVLDYLLAQARAGAHVLQLFDSWVGALAPDEYRTRVLPFTAPIFEGLRAAGVPTVHFGTGTAGMLSLMREAGGEVIGLDWRVDLGAAWQSIGFDAGVQGNLDPAMLLAPWPVVEAGARRILRSAAGRPGHIFNLGHGVLPETPVEHMQRVVELVHAETGG
ncbi:MAG TPA: uroporphyrinogen decarboxylase [Candidatus Limnocylindrales bacterium]|nr:uroporphyrinogen decarboxylase [Candidatus Limnocylindrales bacterium]